MKKILVTGAGGQLANCFEKIATHYDDEFVFLDSKSLDITCLENVQSVFNEINPDYCINTAAYTAVDLAEKEQEKAFLVNADGVKNLAETCQEYKTTLIHISTDYVFDGETNLPYTEDDFTNPLGVYGASKRQGEIFALEYCSQTIVVRTSWLYSEFNKNFVKTMLSLFQQKDELGIVGDQFGQPTNANDLAEVIMVMIASENKKYGIYHFSNYPETTWFDFTKKIAELVNAQTLIKKITTDDYPTLAKRPKRSTFCLDKIEKDYQVEIKYWERSLENCLEILKK